MTRTVKTIKRTRPGPIRKKSVVVDEIFCRELLRQLNLEVAGRPHVIPGKPVEDEKEWDRAGRPHLWQCVQTKLDASFWIDHGHGCAIIVVSNKIVAFSETLEFVLEARDGHWIAIDADRFNTSDYLYRR